MTGLPGAEDATPALPDAAALVVGARVAVLVDADGTISRHALGNGPVPLSGPPLVCHARAVARRLGRDHLPAFDLLELYAFVHPARFCVPTPAGLARALGLPVPEDAEAECLTLHRAAARLLADLGRGRRSQSSDTASSDPGAIAAAMARGGWPWAPFVRLALGLDPEAAGDAARDAALAVWAHLPEWAEAAPEPPPGSQPVTPAEARARLTALVWRSDGAEARPQQADYADAVSTAFTPRARAGSPNLVLAEAGTGVGKTLGYLAPASLWAEKNAGPVWVSTYTRNLQHQIDAELDRLHRDPSVKAVKVVVRKGRENYLCLLNLEEAVRALPTQPQAAVAVGLMARWTAACRDGDLQGGDFPGWLADLVGRARTLGLADRRGECVYSACTHYHRCFIERSVRRARRADIVIANHALVMIQAALGGDDAVLPTRYVFDEGHHVFDAADSAFAAHLSGREAAELRRWLLGAENGRGRARGLTRRIGDLVAADEDAMERLEALLAAARALPGEGWMARVAGDQPQGPLEAFLALVRTQVLARSAAGDSPYGLEADPRPPVDGMAEAAQRLDAALGRIAGPAGDLAARLKARLADEAADLDSDTRRRIEAAWRGLAHRAALTLSAWRAMLQALEAATEPANDEGDEPETVDWFAIERIDGHDVDVGYYRHHLDPTRPFAETVLAQAHGAVVTSATLTDGSGNAEADWQAAERLSGAIHLPAPAIRTRVRSPFDYPARTRVFVVNDVRKDDLDQVAASYRALFLAAGGGGLGLFTAITRLRAVHARIAAPLEDAGIQLYAQHVDGLDVGTLVDIFRGDERACLLGTDAVRDGVDVPGPSLRLIVFDRVPWPRPTILHRARRQAFGGPRYDDRLTRLRLKQAFGRLVRRADDVGVFVLLDPMMPSRLAGAFPDGVAINRVGLAEAVAETRSFLRSLSPQ